MVQERRDVPAFKQLVHDMPLNFVEWHCNPELLNNRAGEGFEFDACRRVIPGEAVLINVVTVDRFVAKFSDFFDKDRGYELYLIVVSVKLLLCA